MRGVMHGWLAASWGCRVLCRPAAHVCFCAVSGREAGARKPVCFVFVVLAVGCLAAFQSNALGEGGGGEAAGQHRFDDDAADDAGRVRHDACTQVLRFVRGRGNGGGRGDTLHASLRFRGLACVVCWDICYDTTVVCRRWCTRCRAWKDCLVWFACVCVFVALAAGKALFRSTRIVILLDVNCASRFVFFGQEASRMAPQTDRLRAR